MAGVWKRPSDRKRGKAGKWTMWWIDEHGKRDREVGTTDKGESERMAQARENRCRLIREGLLDPKEIKQQEAARQTVQSHIDDYQTDLLAKGDTPKHAKHVAGVVKRLLAAAAVETVADLAVDRIQAAVARLKVTRSARTCNHAIRAVRAFADFLHISNRIKEVPRGLAGIPLYNEDADRRRVRRPLSKAELDRVVAAATNGPTLVAERPGRGKPPSAWITGPQRALLYLTAMGTGFRADELRTLFPERFALDGDDPSITVLAAYAKNGKEAKQPILPELAAQLRPLLEGAEPGKPVLVVPEKTAAMLRVDLAAAGIPYETARGVVDFHALRHSYITHLILSGADPKTVQTLARHSSITLTIDRYTTTDDERQRAALAKVAAPADGPKAARARAPK